MDDYKLTDQQKALMVFVVAAFTLAVLALLMGPILLG
jgi:hypothetical protein